MLFSQELPRPFFAAPCRDMSIDVLQLLTKQIATQVQTLVGAPQPQGKHADTLKSLYTAFGQGLAIVGGLMNAAAPINRIPPELLASIFSLSPGTHSPRSRLPYWPFEEPHVHDLHKLPKVCRYWRELALATPTLWSTVVTVPHSQGSDSCFVRSIYLPDDLSADLVVHFNPRAPSKGSVERMTACMLTNGPRIRELHAWDASPIEDLPLFLQSFDASALEHCTISQTIIFEVPIGIPYKPGRLLFFSNGGARLRSLCLTDLQVLPGNEFPALTLLKVGFVRRRSVSLCWGIEDLVKFLAGSPKLEEVYVHDMPYSERNIWDKSPPAPLPRLQYLAFTYCLDIVSEDPTHPTDLLLSRISIPPTCHMYLPAPSGKKQGLTKGVADILDSVCRHVPGKDAVSHVFLRLSGLSSAIQLVFRQGSLQLEIPPNGATTTFPYRDLFHAFPHLLAPAEELRIHYDADRTMAGLSSLSPAAFPNVNAISIIRVVDVWWPVGSKPTLGAGLAHLVQPPSMSPSGVESAEQEQEHWPYPALDTLWTSVESSDEIGELETTLAARAALGFPIRHLVVTVRYSPPADSDHVARLQTLDADEVIVMDAEAGGALREVDWMVRLPERYSLPPSVHRDWRTVWGSQK